MAALMSAPQPDHPHHAGMDIDTGDRCDGAASEVGRITAVRRGHGTGKPHAAKPKQYGLPAVCMWFPCMTTCCAVAFKLPVHPLALTGPWRPCA